MRNVFKKLTAILIVFFSLSIELALLISDFGKGETPQSRLIAIISLAIIAGCILWLLFSRKRKMAALLILAAVIFVFLASVVWPGVISRYFAEPATSEKQLTPPKPP